MGFTTTWLSLLLSTLGDELSPEQKRAVFGRCSGPCTEPWATKAAELRRQLAPDSGTAALLSAFVAVLPGGGPEVKADGDYIAWSFAPERCPCPVGQTTGSPHVCLCGTEHVRGMLEALLGRPVSVTLEQSLLRGDDRCSYTIEVAPG